MVETWVPSARLLVAYRRARSTKSHINASLDETRETDMRRVLQQKRTDRKGDTGQTPSKRAYMTDSRQERELNMQQCEE